jgi:hypothetical protein
MLLPFDAEDAAKEALLEVPKELELTEECAVYEEKDIVDRKDQDVVQHGDAQGLRTIADETGYHRPLQQKHSGSGTRKYK